MSSSNSSQGVASEPSQGYTFSLTVRTDRPIAECELQPHPFFTVKAGNIDNTTRGKLLDSNPHYFSFKWSRGPQLQACTNIDCPRAKTYDPMVWTKFSRGGPGLNCAICEKNNVPKRESAFCSSKCFQSAWKSHCAQKHSFITPRKESISADNTEDEIIVENPFITNDVEKSDWPVVSKDKSYAPTEQDVGCVLCVEVTAHSVNDNTILAGPVSIVTEPVLSAPKAPPKRPLITIPGALVGSPAPLARFRIVSYNILSELYATKQAYPYCDSWSLNWPYRRKMLLQELEDSQGDLICLQEVQADHFELQLKPLLSDMGYDGLFKQKSRESMGQYGKVDGCGVFWRRSKFILNESYTVDFNERALSMALAIGLDETETRKYINRLSKDNIAQVLLLEVLTPSGNRSNSIGQRQSRQVICLANTHLYSNYQRPDVKLWQTYALITEIERIVVPRDVPLILCGDFNSEPESAVYELLTQGTLVGPHPELEEKGDFRVLPQLKNIIQSLDLASVMTAPTGTEPVFTNFTGKFRGTLDYMFYSPSRLRVLAIAAVPPEKDLERDCGEGLPSACYPSDHVHLCCDLALMAASSGSLTRNNMHDMGGNNMYNMDNGRVPMSGKSAGRR